VAAGSFVRTPFYYAELFHALQAMVNGKRAFFTKCYFNVQLFEMALLTRFVIFLVVSCCI
jgi:hypothetical protein